MKPIMLKMSAFGSYRNEAVIDFTRADHGIFLITGDTGAGKTTIFDAITYALYDKSSTDIRDGSMMRSQYAENDTPTYVEYTFRIQDEVYTIRRNPSYQRESKRRLKDGTVQMTQEAARVSLTMPDGTAYPGSIKEINEKIKSITGLGADEFTQTVMLAQGEFLRLLLASSKERKDIFAKIFDTAIYGRIQEALRSNVKQIDGQIKECRKNWDIYTSQLEAVPDADAQSVLEWLKKQIEDDERLEKEQAGLAEQYTDETGKHKAALLIIKKQEELFLSLKKAEQLKAQFESKAAAAAQYREKLSRAERSLRAGEAVQQKEILAKRIAENIKLRENADANLKKIEKNAERLKKVLDLTQKEWDDRAEPAKQELTRLLDAEKKYEQLDEAKKQEAQAQKTADALSVQSQKMAAALEADRLAKRELEQRQSMLVSAQVQQQKAQAECDLHDRRIKTFQKLLEEFYTVKNALQENKAAAEAALKASQAYQKASDRYEQLYRSFIREQAGLLAKDLKEGVPCPVCGAVHHPQPCTLSAEAATQAETEKAGSQAEKYRRQAEEARAAASEKKSYLNAVYEQLIKDTKEEMGDSFRLEGELTSQFEDNIAKEKKLLIQTKEALSRAQQDYREYLKGEETRAKLSEHITALEKASEDINRQLQSAAAKLSAAVQQVKLLTGELTYSDHSQAILRQKTLKESISRLESRLTGAREELQKEREIKKSLSVRLEELAQEKEQLTEEDKEARERLKKVLAELGFADEADRNAAYMSQEDMNRLKEQLDSFDAKKAAAYAQYEALKSQTAGLHREDAGAREAKLNELLQKQAQISSQAKNTYEKLCRERSAYAQLAEIKKKEDRLMAEYAIAGRLDKTANGHLNFQTYIQRHYFRIIIGRANKRLTEMTAGEYQLRCRDMDKLGKQGEVGLDLDVYSTITGKQRDVKTLSGGESFMAALSMALGMADVISSTTGSVHMDMMFIDEGFGSLDDEARNQAIRVLCELAGSSRLIGIISHVTQLKEQIDRKLIVKRTDRGSEVRWEL